MKRNSMRVVCNPYTNRVSYFFRNEAGAWEVLSGSSPLSRQFYTNMTINDKNKAKKIIEKIDEIYNRKNKGIDIWFEGTASNYRSFLDTIHEMFPGRDIQCKPGTTCIAVLGKKAVGKSTLIEGLELLQGLNYKETPTINYTKYSDDCNHAVWYEVAGIGLEAGNTARAFRTVELLSQEGLSSVIYCISAMSGKIEEPERQLIQKIANNFPELKVMVVLTMCYKDDVQETIDEIEKITHHVKIVPVLAKDYKTSIKNADGTPFIVESFGLETVSKYVFEGR